MFREGLTWQLNLTDADADAADRMCNTYSLFCYTRRDKNIVKKINLLNTLIPAIRSYGFGFHPTMLE
jgi:hypothetical protein